MIKFWYKRNLNSIQKIQFDEIVKKYYLDLEEFRKKDKKLVILRAIQICSFLNFNFYYIFVKNEFFFFNDLFITYYSFSSTMSIIIAAITTYKIYKIEKDFLLNYDFSNCNPRYFAFSYLCVKAKAALYVVGGAVASCGITSINTNVETLTGYNGLREFGMYTGLHKDSPNTIWKKKDILE